jgi:hypothetical protein
MSIFWSVTRFFKEILEVLSTDQIFINVKWSNIECFLMVHLWLRFPEELNILGVIFILVKRLLLDTMRFEIVLGSIHQDHVICVTLSI